MCADDVVYYDEIIKGKKIVLPDDKGNKKYDFGSIFWVPILYFEQNRQIWRPSEYEDEGTTARFFCIQEMGEDAFKESTPLRNPRLESTEEFPVVRAKKRPCVFIKNHETHKTNPNCQVIPMYAIDDELGRRKPKYSDDFVDEIRSLKYGHLFYLDMDSHKKMKSSVLRLDLNVCIPRNYLEYSKLCLNDEVAEILSDHIVRFYTETVNKETIYEEIMKENKYYL